LDIVCALFWFAGAGAVGIVPVGGRF